MKIKELINNLQKYDQDMEIILEPYISYRDSENCQLAYDILGGKYPQLGLRTSEVGSYQLKDAHEYADFDSEEELIESKEVVILSSTQFKYGKGNDDRS